MPSPNGVAEVTLVGPPGGGAAPPSPSIALDQFRVTAHTVAAVLTAADVEGTHVMQNTVGEELLTLPPTSAALVGRDTTIFKEGVADCGFRADAGDAIADASVGSDLVNIMGPVQALQASITLRCVRVGLWAIVSSVGVWETR